MKALRYLRSLTSISFGPDQRLLVHLYRALIRRRLHYASIVYCSAPEKCLKELNVVTNDGTNTTTGAFRSSPVKPLEAMGNERPLDLRRMLQTLKFYFKKRSLLKKKIDIEFKQ